MPVKATDKIRVLETLPQADHREVVEQLEECLRLAKADHSVRTVVVLLESQKTVSYYWTGCNDRAVLGSRLIAAGLKRMGLK